MLSRLLRWGALSIAVAAMGCGGVATDVDGDGDSRLCGEEVGASPRVLVSGAPRGVLLGDERALYLVAHTGPVLRVDRCTGATTELANLGPGNGVAVLHGGFVYWTRDEADARSLYRVPASGGAPEHLIAGLPWAGAIGATGDRLFLKSLADDAEGEASTLEVRAITVGASGVIDPAPSLLASLPHNAPMIRYFGFGVSAAGIFYVKSFDCGCDPPLYRLSLDGGEDEEVEGAEGANAFFVTDEWIYVAPARTDANRGIFRVRPEGGMAERVVTTTHPTSYGVGEVLADDEQVCWTVYERSPRCAPVGEVAPPERSLDAADAASEQLVFAGDGIYWLRGAPAAELVDVLGAPR
jgi:hypothetical protein